MRPAERQVLAWEGRFTSHLAESIERFLEADPPPVEPSEIARGAAPWAAALERHGRARLERAGAGQLAVVR